MNVILSASKESRIPVPFKEEILRLLPQMTLPTGFLTGREIGGVTFFENA